MKLLYATSLSYPSTLANRLQVKATSEALGRQLHDNFLLGISKAGNETFSCKIVEMGQSRKSPFLAWKYFRLISREKITHVHVREERLAFFLRFYSKLFFRPFIITYEAHFVAEDFFYKYTARHADGIIAITNGIKNELMGWGIDTKKILVAADAVDVARFTVPSEKHNRSALGLPTDKKIIIYTGSFTRYNWKGIDVMLDATVNAPSDWFFVLIGGTTEEIKALKEKYPSSQILLKEHLPQEKVAQFLAAADILVIPNKKGERASEYYTSPLKLFEYMASGVPIVASDIASIREIVNENEVTFFAANDANALHAAISHVFAEQNEAWRKAEKASQKVKSEYTWDKRAERIISFLHGFKN